MDKKLLDICYKKYNKQISKSWDEIAKDFGFISGESLRTKFKKYRKEHGELPTKQVEMDKNHERKLTELQLKEIELKKERIRLSDLRTSLNKDIRYLARKESLHESIKESIKDLPLFEYIPPSNCFINDEDNEMVIQFSDSHFGLEIHNELENYNEEVFIERLNNYVFQIIKIQEKEKISNCHVCFSGDVLSGLIHYRIEMNNEYGIVQQAKRFSELASKFLAVLSNNFNKVIVHFVTGNHSRNNEDKKKSENKDRYENFVLEFIKIRTENLKNIIFEDSILENTIAKFNVKGHNCVLSHGDYGTPKNEPNKLYSLLGFKPELIFLGHRHIFEILTVDNCKVITSGCWSVNDEYCTNKRLIGKPSQTVTIIGKQGFINAYDCNLI